jgi:hypothetical protein
VPSLAVILAAILDVLGLLQAVKSLVQAIKGASENAAVEASPFSIDLRTQSTDNILHDPTVGLANLELQIGLVREDYGVGHAACILDVLTAIALLTPVTLPTTPPPGYGGASLTDIWAQTLEVGQMCALD